MPTRKSNKGKRKPAAKRSRRSAKPAATPVRHAHSAPRRHSAGPRRSSGKAATGPASMNMSLSDLQRLAHAKGIPYGGLLKSRLVHKINTY